MFGVCVHKELIGYNTDDYPEFQLNWSSSGRLLSN